MKSTDRISQLVVLVLGLWALPTYALDLVIPTNNATAWAQTNAYSPFMVAGRYQQVFSSNQFRHVQRPQQITGIAYRYRTVPVSDWALLERFVEIRLSTTSRQPGQLSTNFAENVGADEQVVLSTNYWKFFGGAASHGLQVFSMGFSFSKPFVYDYTKGNLLLEVRMPGSYYRSNYSLDAVLDPHEATSCLYGSSTNSLSGFALWAIAVARFSFEDTILRTMSLSATESLPSIQWTSITNARYAVEKSVDGLASFATTTTNIVATPPTNKFTDTEAVSGPAFYRIRREQ